MAYNALNNLIDAYIYANGVQAITGQILNGVLKQMVSQLGSGYHLMGVAGPETAPEQNDFAMAYFAATAGEYTDFGGITLAAGEVAVLLTSGNGSWEKQTIYTVPTTTEDLENTADVLLGNKPYPIPIETPEQPKVRKKPGRKPKTVEQWASDTAREVRQAEKMSKNEFVEYFGGKG